MEIDKELFVELLRQAAEKGLEVGEKGTRGDYTDSGIAFYVYRDYEDAKDTK